MRNVNGKRPAPYVALVLDLDGTLVGRDGRVSPRVRDAVKLVADRLHVSIASGREPADVLSVAGQLGLKAPLICDGGATLLDPVTGQHMASTPLTPTNARAIMDRICLLKTPFIATYPGGSAMSMAELNGWRLTRISALDMSEAAADELAACFCAHPGLNVVKVFLPYNGLWAVDFTRAGVNKATAAAKLGQLLGIETCQMIAAGDSYNDLPLLSVCGLRIVMGQAPEELKAIADHIAPPVDEDGLAVAIEKFVLPKLRKAPGAR